MEDLCGATMYSKELVHYTPTLPDEDYAEAHPVSYTMDSLSTDPTSSHLFCSWATPQMPHKICAAVTVSVTIVDRV